MVTRQYDLVMVGPVKSSQLAVVMQSDITDLSPTVLAAPVVRQPKTQHVAKLNVSVEHEDVAYTVLVQEMAAIPRSHIRKVVGNCSNLHQDFMRAIDLLFAGI